ncbi:MAG: hypothetical protein Q9182_007526, partial [Xanthomendoza sp. 2 TL-2023]
LTNVDTQAGSIFFTLSPEIRLLIYTHLFSTQTLLFPHLGHPLLSVSKQIHDEALPAYHRDVQFDFGSTKHLLDFLSTFDHHTIGKLGHISVSAYPISVDATPPGESFYTIYNGDIDDVLAFFPGLQLLSLKVRDMHHKPGLQWRGNLGGSYSALERLISCQGYKKLIYEVLDEFFMGATLHKWDFLITGPQPSTWDAMIKSADGINSGASVHIYQPCGDQLIPLRHYEINDGLGHPPSHDSIEIHVKRGRGADYTQAGLNGALTIRLHGYLPDMSWKEMKETGAFLDIMENGVRFKDVGKFLDESDEDFAVDEVQTSLSNGEGCTGDEDDEDDDDDGESGSTDQSFTSDKECETTENVTLPEGST